MIGMILGIIGMFGSLIMGVLTLFGMVKFTISIMSLTLLAFIPSLFLIVWTFLTGGIADVFAKARITGDPIGIVLRNDKKIAFAQMVMEGGLAKNRQYGRFIIIPDSIYNMPNGTVGFLAYYKYGVSLHPRFVRGTTRLREMGITDIEQVENLNKEMEKQGKEIEVKLDAT